MSTMHLVPQDLQKLYHVREWRNAAGVLQTAWPKEWQEIVDVLRGFKLYRSEVQVGGGGRSLVSKRIDGAFYERGWIEKEFETAIKVDDETYESPTHKVDCLKGRVALEVEWNNKDPFFDRDLNNFRLLFDLRAIEVGVIVTRATELNPFLREQKVKKFGKASTHHEKLWPKIEGGGGGGCPVLTFAITPDLYVDDGPPTPKQVAEVQAESDDD